MDDNWNAGDAYENYMGRWSRLLVRSFVSWLDTPAGARWLDVECGTGALTSAICDLADPAWVLACDPSESFVNLATIKLSDSRVSLAVAGAENFIVRNFLSDPARAQILKAKG